MNWLIVLFSVVIAQLMRYSNTQDQKKKEWLAKNWDEIFLSIFSAVVLMLVLMNDSIILWLDKTLLGGVSLPTDAIEAIFALIIGLSNVSIIRLIMKVTKRKIKEKSAKI